MAQTAGYSGVVHANASHRALAIPELLWLICGFLDKKACAAWMRTSRRLFEISAPFLWEDVDLKLVVLLIPGVTVAMDRWPGRSNVYEISESTNLERFKVYRSFVKTAWTAWPYKFLETWSGANATRELPKPLLPNLQTLIIGTHGQVDGSYLDWIPRVLTPGLEELKLYSVVGEDFEEYIVNRETHAWVDRSTYERLINAVQRICPTIKSLDILPTEKGGRWSDQCASSTACKVASLRNLRSLSFGCSGISQPFFQVLGQLPRLESLTFLNYFSPDLSGPIFLSDGSFSALRHLTLRGVNLLIVEQISMFPQLFRRLISANITYEATAGDGDTNQYLCSAYAMKCFSYGCSHLTDLTILTHGASGWFNPFRLLFGSFKQMPLRRLKVCAINLNPKADESDDEDESMLKKSDPELTWKELFAAVPYLEELHLHCQELELKELANFAEFLPELRLLSLPIIRFNKKEGFYSLTGRSAATQSVVIQCGDYLDSKGFCPSAVEAPQVARQVYYCAQSID
ncbi:hypothetical protein FRC12_010564 [Ceratobasidium sp. 428]|nr:hypothetical protein FRC12_010564 [Ceratobasidium sp. 428]